MRVETDGDRVLKVAESEGERMRLRHEAAALRACAHPGVVPLVSAEGGDPPARLVMPRLPGGTLGQVHVPFDVMAGVVAALAVTVADLHDIGWTHGAIGADHVLLDDRGRPVLGGFGRSGRPGDDDGLAAHSAQDVAALAALLRPVLPAHADRKLVRLLAPAAGGRGSGRAIPARHLAARIVELVPNARLEPAAGATTLVQPDAGVTGPAASRCLRVPRRAGVVAGIAGLAGAGLVAAGLVAAVLYHGGPAVPARPPAGVAGPVTPPQQPVGRYLLADPAATRLVTVTGRWGCATPRPAALDPGTGWVWMFDAWPGPGQSQTARAVAHLPGASGLAVEEVRAGCDQLVVLARSGARQVVSSGPVRAALP